MRGTPVPFQTPIQCLDYSLGGGVMSQFSETIIQDVTRRSFLSRAAIFAGYCVFSCELEAQQPNAKYGMPPVHALDDKNVIHRRGVFKSGTEDLDAYLARPNKKGRVPIVVVSAVNRQC